MTDRSPSEPPAQPAAPHERGARPTHGSAASEIGFGNTRLLLIFTPSVQDAGFMRQKELLDEAGDGLAQRGVLVVEVVGGNLVTAGGQTVAAEEAGRLRAHWRAGPDVLTVVLAGQDGTEQLRANQPMSAGPLFAVIDSLPARSQGSDARPGN